MRIPVISGVIDRRILANYHIDPDVMAKVLPTPFRPLIIHDYAIGGICLIRLKNIRPRFFPFPWGISSENAAHRIAVEWEVDGQMQEGVYIPRRDTSSRLNALVGGTFFPGIHHHASFQVEESTEYFSVNMQSDDGQAYVHVSGNITNKLPTSSVFPSVAAVSEFFERGSLGYSDTKTDGLYDGIELCCQNWSVAPLDVEKVESSYFEDKSLFPKGSVEFDCALLMQNIQHEWHSREDVCCLNPIEA
jgi:Uncharacterized conserved protein (COG2071)